MSSAIAPVSLTLILTLTLTLTLTRTLTLTLTLTLNLTLTLTLTLTLARSRCGCAPTCRRTRRRSSCSERTGCTTSSARAARPCRLTLTRARTLT